MTKNRSVNENEIIKSAKMGNKRAMEQLYESSYKYIYAFVRSKIDDIEVSKDIIAESYVKAFTALKDFRGDSSFKTWLYVIARNEVYKYYKQKAKTITMDEDTINYVSSNADAGSIKRKGTYKMISKILNKLPERYAEVLRLRYLMNLSIKETAYAMSTTVGNVKILTNRALKKARKLIENAKWKT